VKPQFGGYTIALRAEQFAVFEEEEQARWFSIPRGAEEIRKKYRTTNIDRLPYVRYCRKNSGIVDALNGIQFFPLWVSMDGISMHRFIDGGETALVRVYDKEGNALYLSPLFLTIMGSRIDGEDFPTTVARFAEKNNGITNETISRLIFEDFVTCIESKLGILLVV